MIRKFWWRLRGDWRKLYWSRWEILCQPKAYGSLGFEDLCKFNDVMLAKQVWWLVHDSDSLFFKVFKAKYFPNCSIFEAKQSSDSYAWKSILKSRKVISMGARWRVGDGRSIRIFFFPESWIPGNLGRKVISPAVSLHRNSTVLNLIDLDSKWWKS